MRVIDKRGVGAVKEARPGTPGETEEPLPNSEASGVAPAPVEQPEQAPELSGKPMEGSAGELQRQELASAAVASVLKTPEVGRKFYIDDVQFQIVAVRPEGLLVVPIGITPSAAKKVRRAMRSAK